MWTVGPRLNTGAIIVWWSVNPCLQKQSRMWVLQDRGCRGSRIQREDVWTAPLLCDDPDRGEFYGCVSKEFHYWAVSLQLYILHHNCLFTTELFAIKTNLISDFLLCAAAVPRRKIIHLWYDWEIIKGIDKPDNVINKSTRPTLSLALVEIILWLNHLSTLNLIGLLKTVAQPLTVQSKNIR